MRSSAEQCKHPVDGQWKHVVCWNAGGNGIVTFYLGLFHKEILRGWTATVFFPQGGDWGCLGAKCVRRVEEEMNGRCPGGGGVDTALG